MTDENPESAELLVVAFNERVFGIERTTGNRVWEHATAKYDPRLYVLDDLVLVLGGTHLDCIDLASGELIWTTSLPFTGDTLLCDGNIAFVGGAGEVQAVSVADGDVLWHQPFRGKGTRSVALALPGIAAQIDRGHY